MADGAAVDVRGVALTDSDFADGGGYLVDAPAAIAVLLSNGAFARGTELLVHGTIDDRYAQRTIRADAAGRRVLGTARTRCRSRRRQPPIGESVEGALVEHRRHDRRRPARPSPAESPFSSIDGSGEVRVFVGDATGIDTSTWSSGTSLHVVGVVGQRDSSGTGTAGYRVQPRDLADVLDARSTGDAVALADLVSDLQCQRAPDPDCFRRRPRRRPRRW